MTAPRPPLLAADMIRQLTERHTSTTVVHRDNGDKELHHITEEPLLDQLAGITGSTTPTDTETNGGGFGSKPTAHLGAHDCVTRINQQARALAEDLGIDTHGSRLRDVLGAISGAIGDQPHPKVRSWWAAARLLTQHDTPAHRPHGVPCINCYETNTLRLRISDELATCTACGEVWDRTGAEGHGSLDILGQHVAWCSEHEVTKARHWLTDADGYPTECVECLDWRQAWAEHKATKETT